MIMALVMRYAHKVKSAFIVRQPAMKNIIKPQAEFSCAKGKVHRILRGQKSAGAFLI